MTWLLNLLDRIRRRRAIALGCLLLVLPVGCDLSPKGRPSVSNEGQQANQQYARGVSKALKNAAAKFRSNVPERQILDELAAEQSGYRVEATRPLMEQLNATQSRQAKAEILERWSQ